MKYSKHLVAEICDLFATGKHSVADICKQVGITEETFYAWKRDNKKSEFSESLKKAEKLRLTAFKEMALSGMAKRLDVFEFEEVTTEWVDSKNKKGESVPKIKSQKKTKKVIMPSDLLIMFTLKNTDSENFKDKQEVVLDDKRDPRKLSDEDLARIATGGK